MKHTLTYIYWAVLTASTGYTLWSYKRVDKASKVICWLVSLGLLTEVAGYLAVRLYQNNYPVYNVSLYLEFVFICLYFNYSIDRFRKWNTGIFIAIAGVILGVVNACFLTSFTTSLNYNFMFLECLTVVCIAPYSMFRMICIEDDNLRLQRKTHFWLPAVLLFYEFSTLWSWGFYPKLGNNNEERAAVFDMALLSVNIITYAAYATLFFLYPKMKRVHV